MNSIERHVGNLLDATTWIIVHGCNARGAMGAGVAKAIVKSALKGLNMHLWLLE